MHQTLIVIQAVIAIILIAVILLQQKGTGLGGAFGGEGNVYRSRRGLERGLFLLTIVLGVSYGLIAGALVFFAR